MFLKYNQVFDFNLFNCGIVIGGISLTGIILYNLFSTSNTKLVEQEIQTDNNTTNTQCIQTELNQNNMSTQTDSNTMNTQFTQTEVVSTKNICIQTELVSTKNISIQTEDDLLFKALQEMLYDSLTPDESYINNEDFQRVIMNNPKYSEYFNNIQNWVNRINSSIINQSPVEGPLNPNSISSQSSTSGPNSIVTSLPESIIPDIINNNAELTQFIESAGSQASDHTLFLEVMDALL